MPKQPAPIADLNSYRAAKKAKESFLVSVNGGFAMSADIGPECALGQKLSKVLGSPDLSYADRQHFGNLIGSLAEAVEIDLSHPDLVETFWVLMVWAMKQNRMRPGRTAHVRRREIEDKLRGFEMIPTTGGGHSYKPEKVTGPQCPWPA